MMNLVLVEDNAEGLYPFSVMHCAWELRCGPERFIDAWQRFLHPSALQLIGRPAHVASYQARRSHDLPQHASNGATLVVSTSLRPSSSVASALAVLRDEPTLYLIDEMPVALYLPAGHGTLNGFATMSEAAAVYPDVRVVYLQGERITELFHCLDHVQRTLWDHDFVGYVPVDVMRLREQGVYCIHAEQVFVGPDVRIDPCVVLDASMGPVIIESGARIQPHSVIYGPCFIGASTLIKAGAKIYGNTVIGEQCKVGGEVENSIIHAFSNKQHEGFLGHSYISEWVNLGAGTNTSDLKNTYGNINITRRSGVVDTKRMFLGLLCGDHSKSGINTMFGTGTVCGINANVFGAGYTASEIPSFAWGATEDLRVYPLKKAVSVARTVMQRRTKELLEEEIVLMNDEWSRNNPAS